MKLLRLLWCLSVCLSILCDWWISYMCRDWYPNSPTFQQVQSRLGLGLGSLWLIASSCFLLYHILYIIASFTEGLWDVNKFLKSRIICDKEDHLDIHCNMLWSTWTHTLHLLVQSSKSHGCNPVALVSMILQILCLCERAFVEG